jgi:hypothetical protein
MSLTLGICRSSLQVAGKAPFGADSVRVLGLGVGGDSWATSRAIASTSKSMKRSITAGGAGSISGGAEIRGSLATVSPNVSPQGLNVGLKENAPAGGIAPIGDDSGTGSTPHGVLGTFHFASRADHGVNDLTHLPKPPVAYNPGNL